MPDFKGYFVAAYVIVAVIFAAYAWSLRARTARAKQTTTER
jgi:hypothetical protein